MRKLDDQEMAALRLAATKRVKLYSGEILPGIGRELMGLGLLDETQEEIDGEQADYYLVTKRGRQVLR